MNIVGRLGIEQRRNRKFQELAAVVAQAWPHERHMFVSTYIALPAYFVGLYCFLRLGSAFHPLAWSITAQITFGALVGYVYTSIAESWQHRFWGHSTTTVRSLLWRIPGFGSYLYKAYWLHNVIHHGKTHRKNFTTLFRSAEERTALHEALTPNQVAFVIFRKYGLTIPYTGYGAFLWLPAFILPWLSRYVGPWAFWAAIPPMFVSPWITQFIHPLMHRTYEEALRESSGLVHLFMRTAYARMVVRHHWLHHRYPKYNFNFLLVGDFLLGVHRTATPDDIKHMIADGVAIH